MNLDTMITLRRACRGTLLSLEGVRILLSHDECSACDILQAMAFKPILEGQSCIVADQTGSGKTLAYLAPLVQMLRAEEEMRQTKQSKKPPRVLVLVPTSELAVQVGAVDCSEQIITPRKASDCH